MNLLTDQDIDAFTAACVEREERTGQARRHYEAAVSKTRRGAVSSPSPVRPEGPASTVAFADRLRGATPPVRAALVAYLERKRATCAPKTVSCLATRLKHFGVFLAHIDPALSLIADLERCRHIEPYLSAQVDAVNSKSGQIITVAERARRVLALAGFLTDVTEWGWPDAPVRRLVFRDDIPKLPKVLPRSGLASYLEDLAENWREWPDARHDQRREIAIGATLGMPTLSLPTRRLSTRDIHEDRGASGAASSPHRTDSHPGEQAAAQPGSGSGPPGPCSGVTVGEASSSSRTGALYQGGGETAGD